MRSERRAGECGVMFSNSLNVAGFGLIVGSATNWLALKIIFEPVESINICGIYTLQGLFLKVRRGFGV